MKRIMLASSPWMMSGKNMALRVVLYERLSQLVVHNQSYEFTDKIGQEVSFTCGDYFKPDEMTKAIQCWQKRTATILEELGAGARPTEMNFAHAANSADLASQYYKEPQREFEADEIPRYHHRELGTPGE